MSHSNLCKICNKYECICGDVTKEVFDPKLELTIEECQSIIAELEHAYITFAQKTLMKMIRFVENASKV